MRPGDVLVFNSREPLCLSSRCHESDSIYGMAILMKVKVAGGNDNSELNTQTQEYLADNFRDSHS